MANVTIIIAHQNYQEYLPECLQSAKKQTVRCRIVLVDDGSDNQEATRQCANEHLFTKEPETYLVTENSEVVTDGTHFAIYLGDKNGPSYARNRAIELTLEDTDYYLILDADDTIKPQKVKLLLETLESFTSLGVAYADYYLYNVHTGLTKKEYKEPYALFSLYQHCIVHSGSLIKKEALLFARNIDPNEQFFDERLRCAEDYDLWLRIAKKYVFAHVPELLTIVKVHNKNSTESVSKDIWNQCLSLVRQKNNG